ncbi:DMT family transporter [Pseudorhodobacter sp. E13]|uniref:DMT family transporter n=1 Tax=Pseudorhodobacter sp. E13 TaxID=2487931 RepID=UPI000F8F4F49|nr:DMT family transporter [Pseudorhodobacter sp. E13]RUS63581.1 DMT family transporter [Pseudorhodobacter sp. E13]
MTPETLRYAALMLAAGIGIPVLAALNAQLGARIGSPSAAAMILFVVAFLAATLTTAVMGGFSALPSAPAQPKHLFLAGLCVAFYVISITTVAPKFGVGNAVFFVLIGQMVAAGLIDHFGLFGARVKPMTWPRGAGIALMMAGVALIQLSSRPAP